MDESNEVRLLGTAIGCGDGLTRDLLMLAGGDADLVREASANCVGINSVKTYIINHRFNRLEERK